LIIHFGVFAVLVDLFSMTSQLVQIDGRDLMASAQPINILPALNLEHLPNRDSTQYGSIYRLDAQNQPGK
jgi:hypothetical protein